MHRLQEEVFYSTPPDGRLLTVCDLRLAVKTCETFPPVIFLAEFTLVYKKCKVKSVSAGSHRVKKTILKQAVLGELCFLLTKFR